MCEKTPLKQFGFHYLDNSYSAWIFPPIGLKIWVSDDQKQWEPVLSTKYPAAKAIQVVRTGVISEMIPTQPTARYVKFRVESQLKNPDWHPGKGLKCWVFVDEIMLE